MKVHGIKSVTIEGVDLAIDDCEITIEIERDSIYICKDVEGSGSISVTKGLLEDGCDYEDLVTISQWCKELIKDIEDDVPELQNNG